MKRSWMISLFLVPVSLLLASVPRENVHREYARTTEKEVSVVVDVAFGSLILERGSKERIAVVDYDEATDDDHRIDVSYDVSGNRGRLRIKSKKSSGDWHIDGSDHDRHDRRVVLKLCTDIPLDIDIELGAGKGELDLTELQVQELQISTGASSVELMCEKPNAIAANEIDIESGVSKFTASSLSNLNFRSLSFSGGIGSYKLDFGGSLRRSSDVKIEVGLGSVVVNVPRQVPARLLYDDSWLSSFDLDDEFSQQHNGVYETSDYHSAANRLTIKLESGLGSVKVRRR